MLEQYFGMKSKHPEAMLLSRVGDFYEAYGEDAETVARALQIALTSKEAGGGRRVAMAGVPHHALPGYLAKLVQQRFVDCACRTAGSAAFQTSSCGATSFASSRPARSSKNICSTASRIIILRQWRSSATRSHLRTSTFRPATARQPPSPAKTPTTKCSPNSAGSGRRRSLRICPRTSARRWRLPLKRSARGWRRPPSVSCRRANVRPSTAFRSTNRLRCIAPLDALTGFVRRTVLRDAQEGGAAWNDPQFYHRRQFLALDPSTRKASGAYARAGCEPPRNAARDA